MNHLIFGNPLIQRYRFSLMKPKQFRIYLSLYIMVALLLLFVNVKSEATADVIFTELMVFQLILLWAAATINSGSAIKDEINNKTYDFFRLLPLTAHQKSIGIIIGKNLMVLLFVAINFLFLVWFALQEFTFFQLVQILLLLLSGSFCFSTNSLLSSIRATSSKRKSGNAAILIFTFFIFSFFLGRIEILHNSQWGKDLFILWFGWKIPWMLLIASMMAYIGGWAYAGSIRKFTWENLCLFTRPGAVLFLLGCELILLGLFLPHLKGEFIRMETYYWFWGSSLLTVLAICFGSIRTFDAYWNKSQTLMKFTKSGFLRKMCLFSNSALALLLFLIWAIFSFVAAARVEMDLRQTTGIIAILFLSYMFLILLMELWTLYRPDYEKIGILLAALGIFYIILPIIFAAMFESPMLATGSPVGLLAYLADGQELTSDWVLGLLVYNILLCAIPASIVTQQWANIRKTRSQIEKE